MSRGNCRRDALNTGDHDRPLARDLAGTTGQSRLPGVGELSADLPLTDELRAGLIEIAVGAACDRDGEARAVEFESLIGHELEPSPALLRRLREIPARSPGRRSAALPARPGTGTALAASYLLAAALTLMLGDPVAAGRRAATNLGAAAGERLLEPAADAGASVRASASRGLDALRRFWQPPEFFTDPPDMPTDRVRAWFRSALDSSSEAAARGLGGLWPLDASGEDNESPFTPGNRPRTTRERSSA